MKEDKATALQSVRKQVTIMILCSCLYIFLLFVAVRGHPERPRAKYDYSEVTRRRQSILNMKHETNQVLDLSLLFYEAQRSGPLPADNR